MYSKYQLFRFRICPLDGGLTGMIFSQYLQDKIPPAVFRLRLVMTVETIGGGIVIPVTLQTKAHIKVESPFYPIHLLNITVAPTAIDAAIQVHCVVEDDKIGVIVHPHPFHRSIFIIVIPEFLHMRMTDDNMLVA